MKAFFWNWPGAGRIGVGAVVGLILAPIAAVNATDGREQPSGLGYISASGIGPLPPAGTTISVESAAHDTIYGGDPLHEQARSAAVEALQTLGYEATNRGSPILRIGVSMAPGPIRMFETPVGARPNVRPGEIAPIPQSGRVPLLDHQVRVPLGGPDRQSRGSYTVTLMLFERGREPLWMATSAASGTIPEPEILVRTLTRTAMNDLGRSVEREFTLSCDDNDVAQGSICPE